MRCAHIQKGSSQESHRVGLAEMRGGACATFGGGGRGCTNSGQGFAWGRAGRHPAWGTGDDGKGEGEENRTGQGGKAVAKSLGFTGRREVHGEGPGGKQSPCQITSGGNLIQENIYQAGREPEKTNRRQKTAMSESASWHHFPGWRFPRAHGGNRGRRGWCRVGAGKRKPLLLGWT